MSNLVMVVDDSLTVRKILEVSLKRAGLDVIAFSDGIEALQALTSSNLQRLPNIVILDVMMPKLNGYAICTSYTLKTIFAPYSYLDAYKPGWYGFSASRTHCRGQYLHDEAVQDAGYCTNGTRLP